jgi:hypothetical protein
VRGGHQVADAAESEEGLRAGAERFAEAGHLLQGAREHRGLGVRAEAESVAEPGAERVDVLERAADLDADEVGRGVGAQRRAGADGAAWTSFIRASSADASQDEGRGQAARDFIGVARDR